MESLHGPRVRVLRVEDTVIAYLADLVDQMEATARKIAEKTMKTGSQSLTVQSNTVNAPAVS
jgi:hypothetical protein